MIPQTSASATYHSIRVYLQVQQRMGRDHMNPDEWGWDRQGRQMDKDPAPADLIEMVQCNCKTCCNTLRCTGRTHVVECFTGCGYCSVMYSNLLDDGD